MKSPSATVIIFLLCFFFCFFFSSSSYQCWRWKSCAREVLKYNWRAGGSQQLIPRWSSLQKKVYFSFSFVADKIVLWALMITTSTTHYKQQFNRCPGDENVDCSFFHCKKWSLCFCANSQTKMAKNDCFTVWRLPSYFFLSKNVNSSHFVDMYCTHLPRVFFRWHAHLISVSCGGGQGTRPFLDRTAQTTTTSDK